MKTGTFTISAVAATLGLVTLAAEPAKADFGVIDVAFHLGPAYVRYHDGYYRADRMYRDGRYRAPAYAPYPRHIAQHDLWHRCHDGHWYRYYDRKHWKKHDKRRYRHRGHGHGHRH